MNRELHIAPIALAAMAVVGLVGPDAPATGAAPALAALAPLNALGAGKRRSWGSFALLGTVLALAVALATGLVPEGSGWNEAVLALSTASALAYALLLGQQVRAHGRIARQIDKDALTGLLNRRGFDRALAGKLELADEDALLAVLFVDLDRFKIVNDTYGHEVGDKLLERVSEILGEHVRQNDLVARVGGDEFVLALSGLREARSAQTVAEKLLKLLNSPLTVAGKRISIGASIGIAIYPGDGESVEDLVKNADEAMYRIKHSGKNHFAFTTQEMDVEQSRRQEVERRLRFAFEDGHFDLAYQPIRTLDESALHGFEVLLRWTSPDLGEVSPGEFIGLAESTGMIVPIGNWALREACFQANSWLSQGYDFERICVNVSPLQFEQPDFVDTVGQALRDSGLPAEKLELEITENVFVRDVSAVAATLRRLTRLGVRSALDDFGTGYSALSYVMHMPFDTIKIDASFVQSLSDPTGRGRPAAAVVRSVCLLASELGKSVTAEGVETETQRQQLVRSGCHRAQGYLFDRPLRRQQVDALLRRGHMASQMRQNESDTRLLLRG